MMNDKTTSPFYAPLNMHMLVLDIHPSIHPPTLCRSGLMQMVMLMLIVVAAPGATFNDNWSDSNTFVNMVTEKG